MRDGIPCINCILCHAELTNNFYSKTKYMVIKNLKFSTLYEFKVRTHDSRGIVSPFAHSVQISTPEKGNYWF